MAASIRQSLSVLFSIGLLVFAATDVSAVEQPSLTAQPRFAFIYLNDEDSANSFKELLKESGLGTDLIALDDVPKTDFVQYAAVIVGSDIKKAWSTSAADFVRDAKKPVLGLGEGGAFLFEKLNLDIGWMHVWHGGDVAVRPVRSVELPFWASFDSDAPDGEELVLFAETGHVGVHLPQPVSGVVLLGQELGSETHYPIVEQDQRYVLWGFTGSPGQMTTLGKKLFLHTCRYVAMADNRSTIEREHQQGASEGETQVTVEERLQQLEERITRLESSTEKTSTIDVPFAGDWVTTANSNPGITRLSINQNNEGQWSIRAWGACHPTDCDWGTTSIHLLGESVSDNSFPYGFASWDHGFKSAHFTLRIEKDELVVESYDIFKDNSGRTNYRRLERFHRENPPAAVSR